MRFVILGDLHYSVDYLEDGQSEARDRIFRLFLEQVAETEPDLVFAIGDTTNRGRIEEMVGLDNIAKESGLNFIRVTGNHDCYVLPKNEIAPFFLGGRPSASETDVYTAFDVANTRFILLDTARDRDFSNYGGFVSDEQLAWLHQQIAEANANPLIQYVKVLGHHPIYNTTRRSTETMLYIANSDAVKEAFANLDKSKQGFYYCGHNHCHSLYGPDDNGWHHIQTADPLDCESYRLIIVEDSRIDVSVINFDLSLPENRNAFETARTSIPQGFTAQDFQKVYGEEHEHNLVVELALK
jgi:3',5'-cyclic AMP phosphodiesterase CpdA